MIKRILVGIAGAPYCETATRTAVDVAQRHDAEITGVTAIDMDAVRDVGPVPLGAGQEAKELREHRLKLTKEIMEASIETFKSLCKGANIKHQVLHEERQSPFDYLLSQSRYHDLTILGLKGIFEFGLPGIPQEDAGLFLVNLLSGGLRPIIAVPEEYRKVKRVLVAYSGSVESAATFRRFFQFQPLADIEVRFVTFGEPERSQRLLSQASAYCAAHGFTVETHNAEGSPHNSLLEEAVSWQADMIVMGNSSKSLLLRRVMGETALHAIRHAELPLFLAQ